MLNPIDAIESRIEKIKADVRLAVQIGITREAASVALSRLVTLDEANAQKYLDALKSMG